MGKRSRGFRSKTRGLRKSKRERGLSKITKSLQKFEIGERVAVVIDPSLHKGMPHPRYQGRTGTVVERKGRAYLVEVKDGGKRRKLISRPEHLKVVK